MIVSLYNPNHVYKQAVLCKSCMQGKPLCRQVSICAGLPFTGTLPLHKESPTLMLRKDPHV